MPSAPEKMTYWIQRADYSEPNSGPIALAEAQSLLLQHDWQEELAYRRKLENAEKDWCPPTIGFAASTGQSLQIRPCDDGTAECEFWEDRRAWGCHGLPADEQAHIVALFYHGDYLFLIKDWQAFEVEAIQNGQGDVLRRIKLPGEAAATQRRDQWLAWAKDIRALRAQPAELTEAEQYLSEDEAYALYVREDSLRKHEEQHREATIKMTRTGRNWGLTIAAGGTVLATLLYSGVPQAWLSEQLTKDLWAWAVMMTCAGLVTGGLQHLELRALLLGTNRARKQADFAKVFCGAVLFVGGAVCIALALAFVLAMLEPWLRPRLWAGLADLLPTLADREPGRFLVASGLMLAIIALAIGSAFAWRRAVKPAESRLASIAAVGGICLGSFTAVALGPFLLMLPVFAV